MNEPVKIGQSSALYQSLSFIEMNNDFKQALKENDVKIVSGWKPTSNRGEAQYFSTGKWYFTKYRWEVREKGNNYQLVEKQYLPSFWLITWAFVLIVASIEAVSFLPFIDTSPLGLLSPLKIHNSIIYIIYSFMGFLFVGYSIDMPDINKSLLENNTNYRRLDWVATCLAPLALIFVNVFITMHISRKFWILSVVSGLFSAFIGFTILFRYRKLKQYSIYFRDIFLFPDQNSLAIGYILVLTVLYTPTLLGFITFNLGFAEYQLSRWLTAYIAIPFFSGFAVIALIDSSRKRTLDKFIIESENYHRTKYNQFLIVLVTIIYQLFFLFLYYRFITLLPYELTSIPVISSSLPIYYLSLGFLIQEIRLIRNYMFILNKDSPDLPFEISEDICLRIVQSNVANSMAFTTFKSNYVILTTEIVEELKSEPSELRAVIAHEESHLEHRDTHLSQLVTHFSPLFLIGANVLHGVFNFTGRELRADKEAAATTSNTHLKNALDHINEANRQSERRDFGVLFNPVTYCGKEGSIIHRFFGTFFGDFAVTRAHPSIETRKEELD